MFHALEQERACSSCREIHRKTEHGLLKLFSRKPTSPDASESLSVAVLGNSNAWSMHVMLWKRQAIRAYGKLAISFASDLDDPPVPAAACVRTSSPRTATLQKRYGPGTLPPVAPQEMYRRGVCFAAILQLNYLLTCFFFFFACCSRPSRVGRWRASPGTDF